MVNKKDVSALNNSVVNIRKSNRRLGHLLSAITKVFNKREKEKAKSDATFSAFSDSLFDKYKEVVTAPVIAKRSPKITVADTTGDFEKDLKKQFEKI